MISTLMISDLIIGVFDEEDCQARESNFDRGLRVGYGPYATMN